MKTRNTLNGTGLERTVRSINGNRSGGWRRWCLGPLLGAVLLAPVAALAGTLTVNTTGDTHSLGYSSNENAPASTASTDSSGHISLRSAIEYASTEGGNWTINLPPGNYNLSLGNLIVGVLPGTTITLNGQGTAANTTIHQTQTGRMVFLVNYNVDANVVFNLANVTVSGGNENSSDPDFFGGGGAMLAGGSSTSPGNVVALNGVVFTGNTANDSTVAASGGAILMTGGGNLAVTNCLFSGNHAGNTGILGGGAIYFDAGGNPGNLSIINATFTGNTVPSSQAQGGAIYLSGAGSGNVDTISQCTFTGNSAGSQGGAIYVASGPLTATLNRITGNTAGTANGLYMFATSSGWANATNNWWGANLGPTGAGGDSVYPPASSTPPLGNGQIAFNPWIMLTNTANPGSISGDGTTTLTASFLQNSRQQPLTAGQVAAMVGVPVSWNGALHGSLGSQQTAIQANGQATAVFTADGSCNNGGANAAVDHATATAGVTVLCLTASVQPPTAQGAVSILFSNNQSVAFSVVSSTNPATPLTNWTVIGTPTNNGSGLYKFTDVSTTNFVRRFYRIRSP